MHPKYEFEFCFSKLWKICKRLFSQNCTKSVANYLLVIHFEKSITENQAEDVLTVRARFMVCTRFTTCFQPIRSEQIFHGYYYSRGKKTWSYCVLAGLFRLRRHKRKRMLKNVFTSSKTRKHCFVNPLFYYIFSIPKQSDQWSKVWKDFIVKGKPYETEEYKSKVPMFWSASLLGIKFLYSN